MNLIVANGPCRHCFYLLDEHLPDQKCLFSHTHWLPFRDKVILECAGTNGVGSYRITTIKFYGHDFHPPEHHNFYIRRYVSQEKNPQNVMFNLNALLDKEIQLYGLDLHTHPWGG